MIGIGLKGLRLQKRNVKLLGFRYATGAMASDGKQQTLLESLRLGNLRDRGLRHECMPLRQIDGALSMQECYANARPLPCREWSAIP